MKLKDLWEKTKHLNPEAEVYVYVGLSPGPSRLTGIHNGYMTRSGPYELVEAGDAEATPSDTLIVLSE